MKSYRDKLWLQWRKEKLERDGLLRDEEALSDRNLAIADNTRLAQEQLDTDTRNYVKATHIPFRSGRDVSVITIGHPFSPKK